MVLTEADTCRTFVVPKLQAAGWDTPPHAINEQRTFTDGRIYFAGRTARRGRQKRADYLLRYRPDFPIAVVEAKARYKHAAEGLQQAKDYAEILGLKFAYATNGAEIIEFDYTTGVECQRSTFPEPDELWQRLCDAEHLGDATVARQLLQPCHPDRTKPLRYYQEIALNRAVQAILQGRQRSLLTLCTGAGKTAIAFQVCWKLWSAGWNTKQTARKPKILFLADRNVLVDDPMAKDFRPFGDARHKIAEGQAVKSRDIYFALYQTMTGDENRPGLYREYPHDFFDLVIIVAKLDKVAGLVGERTKVIETAEHDAKAILANAFRKIIDGVPYRPMSEVAPLVRRLVEIEPDQPYTEIGIKSFYNGIFHRRTMNGAEYSWQKLFWIKEDDLIFSNLMAWEKAIAVASAKDVGCVGNHRMLTCEVNRTLATPNFLLAYFKTEEGFMQVTGHSPGSIARNKTLSSKKLPTIKVPVPPLERQRWFDGLQGQVQQVEALRESAGEDVEALLPALLHGVFRHADAAF